MIVIISRSTTTNNYDGDDPEHQKSRSSNNDFPKPHPKRVLLINIELVSLCSDTPYSFRTLKVYVSYFWLGVFFFDLEPESESVNSP